MRVAVIGSNGQVGTEIVVAARRTGLDVIPLTHAACEVTDPASLDAVFRSLEAGDAVVNTAAFHRTDDCEDDPERAMAVNALGAYNVAAAARRRGAVSVFLSSDFVFDGTKSAAYVESDTPRPINAYGVSKIAGEMLGAHANPSHYVVRISSVFGAAGALLALAWYSEAHRAPDRGAAQDEQQACENDVDPIGDRQVAMVVGDLADQHDPPYRRAVSDARCARTRCGLRGTLRDHDRRCVRTRCGPARRTFTPARRVRAARLDRHAELERAGLYGARRALHSLASARAVRDHHHLQRHGAGHGRPPRCATSSRKLSVSRACSMASAGCAATASSTCKSPLE